MIRVRRPLDKESMFRRIRRLYKTKSAGLRQRLDNRLGRDKDVFGGQDVLCNECGW